MRRFRQRASNSHRKRRHSCTILTPSYRHHPIQRVQVAKLPVQAAASPPRLGELSAVKLSGSGTSTSAATGTLTIMPGPPQLPDPATTPVITDDTMSVAHTEAARPSVGRPSALSDEPTTTDYLGRDKLVRALAALIADRVLPVRLQFPRGAAAARQCGAGRQAGRFSSRRRAAPGSSTVARELALRPLDRRSAGAR